MKIVHISTSDMGGAGLAAKQLHVELLNAHIYSHLFTKVKLGQDVPQHFAPIKTNSKWSKIIGRISLTIKYRFPFFDNNLNYYKKNKPEGFDYFSFPYSESNLETNPIIQEADILHLHWIADDFVDYQKILSLNKKIVWTLHDMNPFTGGCHHSDGCYKFKTHCNYCFQLQGSPDEYLSGKILNYKLNALQQLQTNQLIITAPSHWLTQLSSESLCFKRFKHYTVSNIIQFNPDYNSIAELRTFFNIDKNHTVFLFVAHTTTNKRKGIDLLLNAFKKIKNKNTITLITIGEKAGLKIDGVTIKELGFITDQSILAKAYQCADAFVLPSFAENFPNTIIESLLCGTPVIASNIGGIPEQINETNGLLANVNDPVDWVNKISYFVEHKNQYNRLEISKAAKEKYNTATILKQYIAIYHQLINS